MDFNSLFGGGLQGLLSEQDQNALKNQAMLQAGLSIMAGSQGGQIGGQRPSLANALLSGLQSGQQAYSGGARNAITRDQLLQKRQQDQQAKEVISSLFGQASPQDALMNGEGPTVANAQKMNMGGNAMKWEQALAKAGATGNPALIDNVLKYKEIYSPSFDVQSVQQLMVDGQLKSFAVGKNGTMKELGVAPEKLIQVDAGGQKFLVSENTGRKISEFNVTQDANSRAQTALGYARLNFDKEQATNPQAKAPAGYRFKPDGTLEAIPGGPADEKASLAGRKEAMRAEMSTASAKNVLQTVQEASKLVGTGTAGFGALAAKVPATEARNLQSKLETIKANLGFDRLQAMREASPTGGALGAVAVQELTALQSTVASLDQAQSPKQLQENLAKIERHYQNWLDTTENRMPKEYGMPSPTAPALNQPMNNPFGLPPNAFAEELKRRERGGK